MPSYDHQCEKCKEISNHMYSIKKDPKEIQCPKCGSDTARLIGTVHLGWDRKMYNSLVKGEDERAEAQSTSHMGEQPYSNLPGELPQ